MSTFSELYKYCEQAIADASNESTIATGFTINRAYEILRSYTNEREYSAKDLFERVAKTYLAIAANIQGKRSGIKRYGVYFDENSLNMAVANGLLVNAEILADGHNAKVEELRVKKNAIDGQQCMDLGNTGNTENMYTEISLETIVKMILEADAI